jgi:hypothetical protein
MHSTLSLSSQFLGQLLLPLQGVVNFFSPPAPGRYQEIAKSPCSASSGIQGTPLLSKALLGQSPQAQVLRSRRAQDGRIVISGRMRDVCAELDRLCDERA